MPLERLRSRSLALRLVRFFGLAATVPLLLTGLFFFLRSERNARLERTEVLREVAKLYAYSMVERLEALDEVPSPDEDPDLWMFLAFGKVRESTLPENTALFVSDSTGRLLVSASSFTRPAEAERLQQGLASTTEGQGRSLRETTALLADIGFLAGSATLPMPQEEPRALRALVVQPESLASGASDRRFVLLVLSAALLSTVLLVFSAVRRGLTPLFQIESDTARLSSGEIEQLAARGWQLRELSAISTTVTRLVDARNRSHESMRLLEEVGAKVQSRSEATDIVRAVLRNVDRVLESESAGCVLFHDGGSGHFLRLEDDREERVPQTDEHRDWLSSHRTIARGERSPFEPEVPTDRTRTRFPIHVDGRLHGYLWSDEVAGTSNEEHREHLGANLARQLEIALATVARSSDLDEYARGALTALARAIDAASPWTAGHSDRVSRLATQFGTFLGLDGEHIVALRQGGRVHDIGKIGIDRSILEKAGPLTAEERREIARHPTIGRQILEPIPGFEAVLELTQQHHEWWNGKGYPHGREGEAIDELARILSVVDVFDSITSDRPYREPFELPAAIEHLRRGAGSQFEPRIVDHFLTFLQLQGSELELNESRQPGEAGNPSARSA